MAKIKKIVPSRLNYRAWVTISYKWVTNEPKGTGGYWINKDMMVEVIQLNLSKNTMRVRFTAHHGGIDTVDMLIQNLMQSTGRVDIDGTEIFENDICDPNDWKDMQVVWSGECWKFKGSDGHYLRFTEVSKIKVKGNIYEKPLN